MKEQYVETFFPRWFIHGESVGEACVVDPNRDIAVVDHETAATLIAERDKIIDVLVRIACKHPETFYEAVNNLS